MSTPLAKRHYDFAATARRDLHVHTPYCGHAAGPMEAYVLAAIERGLEEIGFLAHVESGVTGRAPTWLTPEQLDVYWAEGRELSRRYEGQIRVSLGVEAGVNIDSLDGLRELLARHRWDRVGLSYHYLMRPEERARFNICSRREAGGGEFDEETVVRINHRYFEHLRDAVAELRPTFVCHLDVTRRYLPDVCTHPQIEPLVHRLLQTMAEADTAVEINTAGFVHRPGGVSHAYPTEWILVEALRLGLDVAICSDSHHPSEIARHFDQAVADCEAALQAAR